MIWVLLVAGFLVLFILGVGYYGSTLIIDIPPLAVPYTPKDFGIPYEDIRFMSEDGLRLAGWFIPAPQPSRSTIIINHGVGSNHGDMLLNTLCLHPYFNLLYYNFRGHAGSEGKFTSLGPLELRDLRGAIRFLKEKKPAFAYRLGIYGHSLGAAVALVGAAENPALEAVAAESSFSSLVRTITHFASRIHGIPAFPFVPVAILFASWRLKTPLRFFSPAKAIGRIAPRPVFLVHAARDFRIPTIDAEELWAAAREPKEQWIVAGADHGDPWMLAKEEYEKRLTDFFRKALAS